ncbi:MAG: TonB-dependent receptor plug domain-containing protein [Tannerellaceae bacterium]|nr:TonB-dependent receptor plug domain-containing protein [Tannerellaceae bacterium]
MLKAQNQPITFPNQEITIREAFNTIEKQTGLTVAFNENHLDVDKTVNLNGGSLNQVLNEILKNTNMTFQIQNNRVIISQQVTEKRVVSGTVSDEFGEPIIGASIMVKGKTAGTITDFDGNFSLEVDPKDILSISYIGYLTQEYNPVGQSTLLITMREDTQKLDEVVVIGYGVVKKKDLTGSVASLKMQDIAAVPVSNALEALQGKISGLDMTRASGEAGSSLGFSLRGNRSLSASNEPLILVDGIQYGNTVDINTSDIESIQVLKDASSTAIYGSRGANGVILITTKKGQIGKPVVSFNMYAGVQSAAGLADIQSGEE